jgi:hypothetical protein
MEYYAQGQGAPTSFAGLEGPVGDLSTGPVLTSLPLPEDWHLRHGAHSPASTGVDTALEGEYHSFNLVTLAILYPPTLRCPLCFFLCPVSVPHFCPFDLKWLGNAKLQV